MRRCWLQYWNSGRGILPGPSTVAVAVTALTTTPPHAPQQVARRPIDYFLVVLTLGGLALYSPVLRWLLHLQREFRADDAVWLTPLALMYSSAAAGLLWMARGGATRRGRLVWASLVMFGLLGWAPSCSYGALATAGTNLLGR